MDKTKKAFFDIMSEYKTIEGDTFKVYEFDKNDIEGVKWFLEMLWSVSFAFDVRVLVEVNEEDRMKVMVRTEDEHWVLHKKEK